DELPEQVEQLEPRAAVGHHVAGGDHGHRVGVARVAEAVEVQRGVVVRQVVGGQRQVLAASLELEAGAAVGGGDVADRHARAQEGIGVDAVAGSEGARVRQVQAVDGRTRQVPHVEGKAGDRPQPVGGVVDHAPGAAGADELPGQVEQ